MLNKKQILTPSILNIIDWKNCILDREINNGWFLLTYKKKTYLVERVGKCKKCGRCCKFFNIGRGHSKTYNKYAMNVLHGKITKWGVILKTKCKQLNKKNKCKIWNKLPGPCKDFPQPIDSTYFFVYKFCGFKFKVIGEVK